MDIPDSVRLEVAISFGSVLHFIHDDFEDKETSHFFAILNDSSNCDNVLILACATSQEYKVLERMRRYEEGTVVSVTGEDYDRFKKRTYFDCNHLISIPKGELLSKLKDNKLSIFEKMPEELISQMREAALKSKLVPTEYKKLIDPNFLPPSLL